MAFIEEEWWKDTKWFKIFLAGCVIAFLVFCLVYNLFLKPDLEHVEKTFGVSVSTSEAVRLYSHNTQGWFGDGEDYSVWQYQNPETLMTSIEWQKGQAFQYDIFERVTTRGIELPEGYYVNERKNYDFTKTFLMGIIGIVGMLFALTILLFFKYSLRKKELMVVEYRLPEYTPAEAGYVYYVGKEFTIDDDTKAELGDLLIAHGTEVDGSLPSKNLQWQVVPSGDEKDTLFKIIGSESDKSIKL